MGNLKRYFRFLLIYVKPILNSKSIYVYLFMQIEDPTNIPDPLKNLCGKTFLFLAQVEKDNIQGGKDYYKVTRVWLGNEISKEEYDYESESKYDLTSNHSADQVLILTI